MVGESRPAAPAAWPPRWRGNGCTTGVQRAPGSGSLPRRPAEAPPGFVPAVPSGSFTSGSSGCGGFSTGGTWRFPGGGPGHLLKAGLLSRWPVASVVLGWPFSLSFWETGGCQAGMPGWPLGSGVHKEIDIAGGRPIAGDRRSQEKWTRNRDRWGERLSGVRDRRARSGSGWALTGGPGAGAGAGGILRAWTG